MGDATPVSIALIKRLTSTPTGYNVEMLRPYILVDEFPTKVIFAEVLVTWVNPPNTIDHKVQLLSPNGDVLFSVPETLEFPSNTPNWGYILSHIPVFFWIHTPGLYRLELLVDDTVVKSISLPVFTHLNLLQRPPHDEPELIAYVFGYDMDPWPGNISDIMTVSGMYMHRPLSYGLVWGNIQGVLEVSVDVYDSNKNLVNQTSHSIKGTYGSGSNFLTSTLYIGSESKYRKKHDGSGIYWYVLRWNNSEIWHPVLFFD